MTRLEHRGRDPDSGRNRWALHLLGLEAAILQGLPDQVEALLTHPDSNRRVIERLFPPSYADPQEDEDNRRLLGETLMEGRRELVGQVRRQLARGAAVGEGVRLDLTPQAMDLLVRFLNDVRLIIATDLGVEGNLGERELDPDDPEAPRFALLEYLGGVESILVEALSREF